jgi:hypothetical protein
MMNDGNSNKAADVSPVLAGEHGDGFNPNADAAEERVHTVIVNYKITPGTFGVCEGFYGMYDEPSITSPKTGTKIVVSGFFDGDEVVDLRARILDATKGGELSNVPMIMTRKDIFRWMDAHREMVNHYADC